MSMPVAFLSTGLSLTAVFAWGTSDFLGGYSARNANAFLLTTVAHCSGLLLMATIATLTHSPFPIPHSVIWAFAGGLSGGSALAIFYRALSQGRMGLTAPVAAVLGAAIPTIVTMFSEGPPGSIHVGGFMLAGIGIWLISRTEDGRGAEGIGMAAISGVGFAGFYLCMRQAGSGSALWIAALSRCGSFLVTGLIVVITRVRFITKQSAAWGMLAGFLDVSGSALFVRASQLGRLDTAVVLTSLYPAVTVLLARLVLKEHFTRWKAVGMFAALLAVPLIAAP